MWDPAKLTDSALASVSMGYQVGVTPLQMAAAVSSIANGGELFEPRIVRAVIADGTRTPVPHKVVRRTVSPGTAATLTEIMEEVVERGTGTRAQIPGFTVAGKTGTAQKVVNGQYSRSDYNASFVGFVPSREPAFAIVVVIDSPHGRNLYYGGSVAAPIFQRIADAALRHQGVPPSINPSPPVLVARRDEARERPDLGTGGAAGHRRRSPATATGSTALFPDLRGLGARDALRMLARLGLTARLQGAGVVVEQEPGGGQPDRARRRRHAQARSRHRRRRPGAATGDAWRAMTVRRAAGRLCARDAPSDERPLLPADRRALDVPCRGVTHDSRQVEAGWVFVALRGLKADGVDFAPQAIAAGAAAVVADRAASTIDDGAVDRRQGRAAGAGVAGGGVLRASRAARCRWSASPGPTARRRPSYLVSAIFEAAGTRCGLMGTVTYRIGDREFAATQDDARGAGAAGDDARRW